MTTTRILSSIALLALTLFTSCDNQETANPFSFDAASIEEDELASKMAEDIINEVDFTTQMLDATTYSISSTKNGTQQDTCPIIRVEHPETAIFPMEITIDYGTENCQDFHGVAKRGQILITLTDRYRTKGSERIVRFQDFHINDFKIEGKKVFRNEGESLDGNPLFSISIENLKITSPGPDSLTYTRNEEKFREMIVGSDTPFYPWDDEFLITGQANGVNVAGVKYSREIITPLHVKRICRFIVAGSVEIKVGEATALLDYGEGACDQYAKLTVGEESKTIELGKYFFRKKN